MSEFCLITDEENLASELKKRYDGIADRLTLYTPFVPGERDEWWKKLAVFFERLRLIWLETNDILQIVINASASSCSK